MLHAREDIPKNPFAIENVPVVGLCDELNLQNINAC